MNTRKRSRGDIARQSFTPRPSNVVAEIDFDREGKQVGFFDVPHSSHDDAWGVVRVPLVVMKNGAGPTVLVAGGNHGDEYEGPIALAELIRVIDPAELTGRIIVLPAMNAPAVAAGTRTSPLDELNLNATFPGDFAGTPTAQICAYVHDYLFPQAHFFLDLHSGGSSLAILPSSIVEHSADPMHHQENIDAARAFGAPTLVRLGPGERPTAIGTANKAGLVVLATELGGGGVVSTEVLATCRRGIRNFLIHAGVLQGQLELVAQSNSQTLSFPGPEGYIRANDAGVFEPISRLGEEVNAGALAGRIHFLDEPARAPVVLHHRIDGVVYAHRNRGRVRPGNCCFVIAQHYAG